MRQAIESTQDLKLLVFIATPQASYLVHSFGYISDPGLSTCLADYCLESCRGKYRKSNCRGVMRQAIESTQDLKLLVFITRLQANYLVHLFGYVSYGG